MQYKASKRRLGNWEAAKALAAKIGVQLANTGDGQTAYVTGDAALVRQFIVEATK